MAIIVMSSHPSRTNLGPTTRSLRLADSESHRNNVCYHHGMSAREWIIDKLGASAFERLAAEHGLHMVLVDYVQLMQGRGRFENRTLELASISRKFYKTSARWREILRANKDKIDNPENLKVGQTLTIP